MDWQGVTTQSYYRLEGDHACNIQDYSAALIVNCCGISAMDAPFKTYAPHGRHDYYLMYVFHGQLQAQAGDAFFTLSPGDALIYSPDQAYGYQRLGDEKMVYLWVHFTGAQAKSILASRSLALDTVFPLSQSLEQEFEAIYQLFITRPRFYLDEANSRLDLLLSLIGRYSQPMADDYRRDRIKKSLNYLHQHYAERITLKHLATMEYLSPSRYSALFRQIMGTAPQQYLIDLRIKNALNLLHATDLSVSEVARSVGYEDALYFSRLFHRHLGFSPRMARERVKGDG